MEITKYLVKEPESISSATPVLVLLHGYGSDENDLFSFAPNLPSDWLVVSLEAPLSTINGGFCWYDIDFSNEEKFINTTQAEQSIQLILNKIDQIKEKYKTNGVVHLCGFSQGGILSYALALTYPDRFKKVACLSSYPEQKILQNIKTKKEMNHLDFFVSHGVDDMVIPLEWGRRGRELLYDMSVFFTFREYLSGHGLNSKNYQDLMAFFGK